MPTAREVLASIAIRMNFDSASMSKSLNKISSDMNIFKQGIKAVAGVIGGLFAVDRIVTWGKESYVAYQGQFKAEQLLLTALKGRKDIQERLIKQAEYLQTTTLFSDEEIINQQKFLASIGLTEKAIKNTLSAAMEFATAKGIDLNTAVMMLARSMGGSLRGIGALIPELKKFTQEELKAGAALDYINTHMKGLAETAANTDPLKKYSIAMQEFKESWGKIMASNVNSSINQWSEWLLLRAQPDLSVWDKWVIDLSTAGRHRLYEEMQMNLLKESSEDTQKAWEEIVKSYNKVIKPGQMMPALSVEDQAKVKNALNPIPVSSAALSPLLEKANNLLKEYKANFEAGTTEKEMSYWGALVEKQGEEVKRLEQLGKSAMDVKANLLDMIKSVKAADFGTVAQLRNTQNMAISAISPTPGKVGTGVNDKGQIENKLDVSLEYTPKTQKYLDDRLKGFEDFAERMKNINQNMVDTIKAGITDMAVGFAEAFGKMIATGEQFDPSMLLEGLASMLGQLGKMAIAAGVATLGIKAALQSLNGYAAIAAGVALVALASAIKSGLSNLAQGGSSSSASISQASSPGGGYNIARNMGDLKPITIIGKISGEDIRLANQRATDRHNNGY